MSYRIDIETLRRYSADGMTSTALSQAQQQRFENAVESALDSREDAGGPGELDAGEERIFVVEEGDSLFEIAEELNVDFNELLELNQRDDLSTPDQIDVGDVVFVPHTSPEEAATSPRDAQGIPEGESDFVQSLREQGNNLEYADDPSAVDMDAEVGELTSDVQTYVSHLPPEEQQAALQRLYDHDWVDAGPAQMAIEQAAEELNLDLGETSHGGPEVENEAREIIADAQAESDPEQALQMLEEAYDNASPAVQSALDRSSEVREIAENSVSDFIAEAQAADDPAEALRIYEEGYSNASERVQAALDRSSDGQAIIDEAVEWAAEPILEEGNDNEMPAARTLQAMERLETLTEDLPPEFAAEVVDAMLPQLEQAQQNFRDEGYAGVEIGYSGTMILNGILDRIAGTEKGDAAVEQVVDMSLFDMNGLRAAMNQAVSEGNRIPAIAIELASREGVMDGFREEVIGTAERFRDQTIGDQSEAYYEHLQELGYLIDTGGSAMTPEQMEAAIEDYIESQGDEWSTELEGMREDLADSGTTLLEHIQQLQSLPDGIRSDYQERIDGLIDDPNARLAVSTALQENPELVRGEAGDALVETFNELGISGDDPLAATLVGAYLNENVLSSAADLDFTDADAMADARQSIEEALSDKPQLAELMGVSTSDLNEIATMLSGVLPSEPLEGSNEFGRVNGILRNLNNTLDQIDGKFVRNSNIPFSTTFRTTAFAIVGSGLINAGHNFLEDPNLRNSAEFGVALSRVGVDSAQLVAAYRNVTDTGTVGNLKAAGRFVHIMGATLAGADAVARFQEGDYLGAGLNAAVAGGVSTALLFGSTSWGGPVGFGIATAASLGLYIQESLKETPYETQTTANFLTHAGFSEEAAEVLIERSEDGYNAVPLLMRYGELHGLTPEQTVEWINSIPQGENGEVMLGALRDNLLNTLDQHLEDGDVSQFNEHIDEGYELISPSLGQSRAGELAPRSVAELDHILPQLDIESPQAYA
ncbi:LysM peptidoglycan-binding domain-containing protein [Halomonas cupida]|uniref:LysM peptidoglycan-binding domain-containing protein n=1 Tax=Halomonas cupida TaxID=44933 RepID=UPI003A91A3B8